MTFWELVLIFMPFFISFFIAGSMIAKQLGSKYELSQILKGSIRSAEEDRVLKELDKEKEKEVQLTFVQKMNAKMNLFGMNYKFEAVLGVLGLVGIACAVLSNLILKAGPFLMLYIGVVMVYVGYQFIQSDLEKRKDNLTMEFTDKLRDLTSYLSAGKSVPVALDECTETGIISPVLYRELTQVRGDIALGRTMSDAFMQMYYRLNIPEIKVFAQTLSVYEEQGGNLISIMQSSDHFFTQKLAVKNEQRVAIAKMLSSQKFMIGIPMAFVFILAIVNPSLYGNFYSTAMGQLVGIVAITMLIIGVFVSRRMAKL